MNLALFRILIFAFSFWAITSIIYFAISFTYLHFNVLQWSNCQRGVLIFLVTALNLINSIIIFGFEAYDDLYKKDTDSE